MLSRLDDGWWEFTRVQKLDSPSPLALEREAHIAMLSMSCMILLILALGQACRASTCIIRGREIQCLEDPEECFFIVVAVPATFQAACILAR